MNSADRRRAVIVAGHTGDAQLARAHLDDADPGVREAALGALDRTGDLTEDDIATGFADGAPSVRRRAVLLAATRPTVSVLGLLDDRDQTVVEAAAWACGEHELVGDAELERLIELATASAEPLVRESAAAALGAIGDPRGLPAVLAACNDRPHIRRRAVLALAAFDGPEVEAALDRALLDRDWQVRQAAEDLRGN
jgi:HEAT repeat protein